jgi:Spy/CpxP family protein refolding chaperone
MFRIVTLMLSLTGLANADPCPFAPCQGAGKGGVQTSTRALQFAPGQRPGDDEKEKIRVRIGITPQQQQQIDDLYNETRARMDEVRKSMGEKQKALWDVYGNYDIDETAARSLRIEILKLHRKFGEIQADNERKLRTILSREQFEKLRQVMKEQWEAKRKQFEERRANRPAGGPSPGRTN